MKLLEVARNPRNGTNVISKSTIERLSPIHFGRGSLLSLNDDFNAPRYATAYLYKRLLGWSTRERRGHYIGINCIILSNNVIVLQ